MTSLGTVAVRLFDDARNQESSIDVNSDLAELLAYAHFWTRQQRPERGPTLTFTSMLAAMVAGPGILSEWLRDHLALRGTPEQVVTNGQLFTRKMLPAEPVGTTVSFRSAHAEASKLAKGRPLGVRHFMAAYAVIENYHREDFLRLRIDRRQWCIELADLLKERFPEEAEQWTAYGARAPKVLVPGFDADLPEGADLLGVAREVEAFAMLIAGRETQTPLSIGVFGAWGSGKSYFMSRVQKRVAALAEAGGAHSAHYYRHIAQVTFNAWHYSEGNVVASLVDQILRKLDLGPSETEQVLAERRSRAQAEIAKAEALRDERRRDLERAAEAENELRERLDQVDRETNASMRAKENELDAARTAVAAAQAQVQEMIDQQARAVEAARKAAPVETAIAVVTGKLLDDERLGKLATDVQRASAEARWLGLNWKNVLWGVVVLALTAVGTAMVSFLRDSKLIAGLIGAVAAITPVALKGLTLLRDLAKKGREYQEAVETRAKAAVAEIEQAGEGTRAASEAALGERAAELDRLRGQIAQLGQRMQTAKLAVEESEGQRKKATAAVGEAIADVADKRKRLESITPGALLEEVIRDLTSTDVFRKELGMLTHVRTSFERLSERMAAAREAHARDPSKQPALERIVLYIDDLDRCPEERVREVLRAVHLLHAFDMFVCVVAVDPRWVIQCLRASPGLVTKDGLPEDFDLEVLGGAATPSDYLEKIFQIPLWLRPVPSAQRAALIGTLLRRNLDRSEAGNELKDVKARVATALALRLGAQSSPGGEAPSQGPPSSPERIKIDRRELAFLPRVAPLLDGNPRALKRFVNTYRLVKASLSDVELEYFANGNPHRVCMAQLAVLATQRARARALVRLADSVSSGRKFSDWLDSLEQDQDGSVKSFARDLRSILMPELERESFSTFAVWLERTRRYSFYL